MSSRKNTPNPLFQEVNLAKKKMISTRIISMIGESKLQKLCEKIGVEYFQHLSEKKEEDTPRGFDDVLDDIIFLAEYIIELDDLERNGELTEEDYIGLKIYKITDLRKAFKISSKIERKFLIEKITEIVESMREQEVVKLNDTSTVKSDTEMAIKMSIKYITGDLLKLFDQGEFDVIAHGCNCFCVMGGGIAKTIKQKYPGAYTIDKTTKKGDREKLGTCGVFSMGDKYIVNCYTEYDYREKKPINYQALEKCMGYLKTNFSGKRIGLPKIGAGLAKGDWEIIEGIISKELKGEDVTVVIYG